LARLALVGVLWVCGSHAAFAQAITAPTTANEPKDPGFAASMAPGGVLAHPELSRQIAGAELDPPAVTRGGGDGSNLEQVFASRCRAVVLVGVILGSGRDEKVGTGTGSIVTPEGHVLTAAHVVAGANKIAVGVFPNCEPGAQPDFFAVNVVRVDPASDLALLKLQTLPRNMVVMPLGDMAALHTGTPIVIIGHPRGLLMSMSQGVVSAIRPNYHWSAGDGLERRATVIQTDGALNPGNSGGPMMTQSGLLIGVNSFILGQASAGLNFAVSVDDVKAFYARINNSRADGSRQGASEPPRPEARHTDCKPNVIKEWKEGGATRRLVDIGCSGKANALLIVPDDPGQRAMLLWDRNGDGKADVRFYLNRNMRPEYSEWDDEFDGSYKYRAEHENGEWEPKAKVRVARR
jgi:S1-C subfamily serine protease